MNIKKSRHYTLPATEDRPVAYEGWIPDPIRSDLSSVDVPAGDMQPFWLELYADGKATPGSYRVKVVLSAEGGITEQMEVRAEVWPFALPDRPELPTSITMNAEILNMVYSLAGKEEFDQMHQKYIDFLETFKIEPDLIYRKAPPTVEELLKIKDKWGLRQFAAYYLYVGWLNLDLKKRETWQPEIDRVLQELGAAMEQYEKAGLADQAYLYGFDEASADQLPLAKEMFTQIKQKFPNLPIMTTYLDKSLGVTSGLAGLVDIWVPGVQAFDPAARDQAQARGIWCTGTPPSGSSIRSPTGSTDMRRAIRVSSWDRCPIR
ncbi:hypothetical protein N6H14_21945 [Paenibacillus sp. CC-CFT747]|nr:hypothetical protein N6H14_21945 [Paenibacillus sp. CC-CFT747]